ncbi:MAG TPA: BrnT family toxin [Steroidobacteraceae bacterium]
MDISFDAAKSERNVAKRGMSFEQAAEFEWDSALLVEDLRRPYGEQRYQALGLIAGRLHMLVYSSGT